MLTGVALTGIVMTACTARANAETRPAATTTATAMAAAPTPPPSNAAPGGGERTLDTNVPMPSRSPAPLPQAAAKNGKRGSDEHLPSWVPVTGRLTVVQSHDLAENLGLVPAGTTKKAEGRISVAEMLAQNGSSQAAVTQPRPIGATWLPSNGRVRHSRGR